MDKEDIDRKVEGIGRVIASNMRAERSRVNISQDEVALKLGITRKTYTNFEQDASKMKLELLIKLSLILGCDIQAFYLL